MATIEHGGEASSDFTAQQTSLHLPRLRWTQILAISIFFLALNLHWAALGIIIIPSQVFKIAGNFNKGTALAYVLVPGAFVALFANPLFGMLSDRTGGWMAAWGKRRPYILFGTIINVGGLIWMASAHTISSLAIAYVIVQFSNNAATAPFHALLPDIVPIEQRGLTSGVMGLLTIAGNIGGVLVAGIFVNSSLPQPIYQQHLFITYGILIAVLVVFMLITIVSIRERNTASAQLAALERTSTYPTMNPQNVATPLVGVEPVGVEPVGVEPVGVEPVGVEPVGVGNVGVRHNWLSRSTVYTIVSTLLVVAVIWGIMAWWNIAHSGVQISGDGQEVVLELIATVGILRLFDFNPRRNPDFAWVFLTRLVMMLGIYTVEDFLQYYMADAVKARNPALETTNFIIILSLTSLVSAFAAGWLSDRFGRKRLVYLAGGFMALVGLVFIITQSLPLVLAAGAIFGLGYGAYTSVDWALVADVLPSHRTYARDMGVWNISLSLSQVVAPILGGPLLDAFTRSGHPILGYQLLFAMAIVYCLLGTVLVRNIRGVKK
jgi:MFS family permease